LRAENRPGPLPKLHVELSLRNEEQSAARVALTYLRGDWFVVEGWFTARA
jgi:hypothetical protein